MSFITAADHANDYAMINDIINSDEHSEAMNESSKYSTPPSNESMDLIQHCSELKDGNSSGSNKESQHNNLSTIGNTGRLEFESTNGPSINAGIESSNSSALSLVGQKLEQLEKMNFAMFEAIRQVSQQIYSCDTKLSEILTHRNLQMNSQANFSGDGGTNHLYGNMNLGGRSGANDLDACQRRKLSWNERLEELKEYKDIHGHCDVPQVHDSGLGTWVSSQRSQHKRFKAGKTSSITKSRKEMLENLGFSWSLRKRFSWDERFMELKKFYDTKGTTEIPNDPNHKSLWAWCQSQRRSYRNAAEGKGPVFPAERIAILNEIGFNWADCSSFSLNPRSSDNTDASNAVLEADDITTELGNHEEIELHI